MLQRALKIGKQQWPIFSTSILISRSIIYSVMNIVMNIQQWKDINNQPSTSAHSKYKIKNMRLDKTGNGSGADLQSSTSVQVRAIRDHMKWASDQARVNTCNLLLFHFVYIVNKLCKNFDNSNAELPWVWLEKMTSILRKILFSSGIELYCRRGVEKIVVYLSYRLYHYKIYKHWDVLQ